MQTIHITPQFRQALDIMENTQENLFLTGKAGTGKSTLLRLFRDQTQKKVVVLAPTGIAALNIQGETIHSFFGFKPHITVKRAKDLGRHHKDNQLVQELQTIIIDEISMVRADLLDCVDAFLRIALKSRKPFGGKQLIFIGDLYQLSPVVTPAEKTYFENIYKSPYFFSAHVFNHKKWTMQFIELDKIYRQSDDTFITILNAVRNRTVTDEHLATLNERVSDDADPEDRGYMYLTATNADADAINTYMLRRLDTTPIECKADISGDFDAKLAPTDSTLILKTGAQVMFLTNDPGGNWVNGTLGTLIESAHEDSELLIQTQDGNLVSVHPYKWNLYHYIYDKDKKTIDQESIGSFTQYPIKLAWAITIHKSQGKTFDRVFINLGRGAFTSGQVYVALSRCRSLDGLILQKPLKKSDIMMDYRVMNFLTRYQYKLAELDLSLEDKVKRIEQAISTRSELKITYLKPTDEKTTRTILPEEVGDMAYNGTTYLGVRGYCLTRNEERVFRVDRILEIH